MPYVNGLQIIKTIRHQLLLTEDRQPVILMHTSSEQDEIREECESLNIANKILKPVKSDDLYDILVNLGNKEASVPKPDLNKDIKQGYFSVKKDQVILVAEDVSLNMILMKTLIKQRLPTVMILEARNGLEALSKIQETPVDLVLMDVQMPEMDGVEATHMIRALKDEIFKNIPIVAVTAGALKEEKEKCLAAGMNDFLTKPVDQEALKRILGKYIGFSEK
jgi:CheY-like chemotaxis protein